MGWSDGYATTCKMVNLTGNSGIAIIKLLYLWIILDKSKSSPLHTLGQILREYRESKGLLLRQVAAALEMDTALLSKFERDEKKPNKEKVLTFAKYYNVNADELLVAWLSDKIADQVQNEDLATQALEEASKKVELHQKNKIK